MMSNIRNQNRDNSKIPFGESESLKESVNQCLRTFYFAHHELLMNEYRHILNEKFTGCQRNDLNPPMVKPFRLTYLAKGGGGGGGVVTTPY